MGEPSDATQDARLSLAGDESTLGPAGSSNAAQPPSLVGEGRYQTGRRLGAGGMGVVYEALDTRLDRPVALKILRSFGRPSDRVRLLREAQALAQLSDPHVVQVYEVGTLNDQAFIAMELVEGQPLDRWLAAEPRSVAEILAVFEQAGRGLQAAHAVGLIHRDFKPSNVLVGNDGRARVLDFGIVQVEGSADQAHDEKAEPDAGSAASSSALLLADEAWADSLTRTGAMMGTPAYMAPEQYGGEAVTAATDQFGYCVALYEALWEQHPFCGSGERDWRSLAHDVIRGSPQAPPDDGRVSQSVRDGIMRGLARRPSERWPSMAELLEVLAPAEARWGNWRRWMAVGAAVVVLGGVLWWSGDRSVEPAASEVCGLRVDALEELWSEPARDRLAGAMQRAAPAYGAQVWAASEPRLDEYVRRWTASAHEACAAPRVLPTEVERHARWSTCLERRRRVFAAQLELFAAADETLVQHASSAVLALDSIEECEHGAVESEAPSPEDAELAAQVEAIRAELAEARIYEESGRMVEFATRVSQLQERAEALGYPPLQVELLVERAQIPADSGELEAARDLFERAYFEAQQIGHAAVSLQAALRLMWLVGRRMREAEQGEVWAKHAWSEIERHGRPLDRIVYHHNLGSILEYGEYEQAERNYREGLDLAARHPELKSPYKAKLHNRLGVVLQHQRRYSEALEEHERALRLFDQLLGGLHPDRIDVQAAMANTLYLSGDKLRAERVVNQVLDAQTQMLGPNHVSTITTLHNLGSMLRMTGRIEASIAIYRDSIARAQQVEGHPELEARGHYLVGLSLRVVDRFDEAEPELRAAVRGYEEALGSTHPQLMEVLLMLASVHRSQGNLDLARRALKRLVEIQEATEHDNLTWLERGTYLWAKVELETENFEEAVMLAERALALSSPSLEPKVRLCLARALWGQAEEKSEAESEAEAKEKAEAEEDRSRALEEAERALTLVEENDVLFATIEAWLAKRR